MSTAEQKNRNYQTASIQKSTLFDLLKRKKPSSLLQTVTKTQQKSNLKNSHYAEIDYPSIKDQKKNSAINKSTSVKQPTSIVSSKIFFQPNRVSEITEKKQEETMIREINRRGKCFLSMISPIKIRSSSVLQQRSQNKKPIQVKKTQTICNYQRNTLTKSINHIKDKVGSLDAKVKKLKCKFRDLTLLLNPVLDYVSSLNHTFSNRVGQVTNIFKILEALIGQVCQNDSGQEIEILHNNLQQHLKSLQSQIRRGCVQERNKQVTLLKNQKEIQIQQLQLDLIKTQKQNEILRRKIEKIQNTNEQIKLNSTNRQNTQLQQTDKVKTKLQCRINQLSNNNQKLQNKLKQAQTEIKVLQKQLKNEKIQKEDLKTKFAKDIHEVTEAKNKQLIDQIMRLKAQFNSDMNRINQLHELKEYELTNKVKQKDEQLAKLNYQKQCNKQIQLKMIEEVNKIQHENLNLKVQVDSLVADMHRMNEELYQHWMGLKDIKVLSSRLGSFAHFRLIYQDIGFNDHLFL